MPIKTQINHQCKNCVRVVDYDLISWRNSYSENGEDLFVMQYTCPLCKQKHYNDGWRHIPSDKELLKEINQLFKK